MIRFKLILYYDDFKFSKNFETSFHRTIPLKTVKFFCKDVKPAFSKKSVYNVKIFLAENKKSFLNDNEIAMTLNDFFWNIIKTSGVSKFDRSCAVSLL